MTSAIDEIRAALDACNQGDARQRWQAQQHLRDHAEAYTEHLLDELDQLTATERDSV
ncbi:hypothetical protein [Actinomyces procaprae]|uniref:hypothetical protein n=1 Tax=Actinomyces procaprae TaxID=2560010 RepID=UPI001448498F|nr:hypothetical protein [Actinomyces procaprae]